MVKRLQLAHLYEVGWNMLRRNTTASYVFGPVLIKVFILAKEDIYIYIDLLLVQEKDLLLMQVLLVQ